MIVVSWFVMSVDALLLVEFLFVLSTIDQK